MNKIIKNYYKFLKTTNESTKIKVRVVDKNQQLKELLEFEHDESTGMDAVLAGFDKIKVSHEFKSKIKRKNFILRFILKPLNLILLIFQNNLKEYKWNSKGGKKNKQIYGLLGEEYTKKMINYCKENNLNLYCFLLKCLDSNLKKTFLESSNTSTSWLLPIIYENNNNFKFMNITLEPLYTLTQYFNKLKYKIILSNYYQMDFSLLIFSIPFISRKIKLKLLNNKKSYFASYSYFGKSMTPADSIFYGITPSSNLCKLTICTGIITGQLVIGLDIHKSISNTQLTSESLIDGIKNEIDIIMK